MRILKWLFHPINLFIIVILVALYLNRHTLFPEHSESPEVKQLSSRVDNVIDSLNATASSSAEGKGTGDSTQPATVTEAGVATTAADTLPTATAPDMQTSNDDLPQGDVVIPQDIPPQPSQEDSASVEQEQQADADSGDNEQQQAAPTGAPVVATDDAAVSDPLVVWETARRAAWEGDSDKAIEHYRTLIAMQPENFDAYGEMGNVMLHKGDRAGAVDAYYQAAVLLGKAGYPQGAWRVLDIVAHLDRNKAQALYEALRRQQADAAQRHQE